MNIFAMARTAVRNSVRSVSRTTLTVIAIFIGAFTLTLTTAVGAGVNQYIDDTVAAIGSQGVLTVTKTVDDVGDGPQAYDPEAVAAHGRGEPGDPGSVEAITPADLDELRAIEGVESAQAVLPITVDYVDTATVEPYEILVAGAAPGSETLLAAGSQLDHDADQFQIALPQSHVDALGFSGASDAIGQDVALAVTDATGAQTEVQATVVAVAEEGLASGTTATVNDALAADLYDRQTTGVPDDQADRWAQASVVFDTAATEESVTALRDDLSDAGYTSTTVEEQIGAFRTVIDVVVLILNAFAVIALLAAGFGIVNTLQMSVKERTREIGLMKAMGLSSGRVFSLFSLEAVFIGLLGSAIGAGVAIAAGTIANSVLAGNLLAGLPGLTITAFTATSVGTIILLVMGIAFLAGTIPALVAARQHPIDALRYE